MFVTKTSLFSVRAIIASVTTLMADVANLCVRTILGHMTHLEAALALNIIGTFRSNVSAGKRNQKYLPRLAAATAYHRLSTVLRDVALLMAIIATTNSASLLKPNLSARRGIRRKTQTTSKLHVVIPSEGMPIPITSTSNANCCRQSFAM